MGLFDGQDPHAQPITKTREIIMNQKQVIEIVAKTVSPLLQIDINGGQRTRYIYDENEKSTYKEPFYSANGLRGFIRRAILEDMTIIIRKKYPNFSLSAEVLHLYAAGAGTDKKSIENVTWKQEPMIRAKAPLLSLFGAGLSQIEGKLAVCDLVPSHTMNRYSVVNGEQGTYLRSILLDQVTYFRDDSSKRNNFLTPLIDKEDVARWLSEHTDKVAESKKKKDGEAAKESDSNIQQPVTIEMMIPGVTLVSSIGPKGGFELNDVELGALVKGLLSISQKQLGAGTRYGWGVLEWSIAIEGKTLFEVQSDKDAILKRHVKISEYAKNLIAIWDTWAEENLTDKINVSDFLEQISQ